VSVASGIVGVRLSNREDAKLAKIGVQDQAEPTREEGTTKTQRHKGGKEEGLNHGGTETQRKTTGGFLLLCVSVPLW